MYARQWFIQLLQSIDETQDWADLLIAMDGNITKIINEEKKRKEMAKQQRKLTKRMKNQGKSDGGIVQVQRRKRKFE